MTDVEKDILEPRGATHGDYEFQAAIAVSLRRVLRGAEHGRDARKLPPLAATHEAALDLIMEKVSRIMAGDPYFEDHWDDIAGYAKIGNRRKDDG